MLVNYKESDGVYVKHKLLWNYYITKLSHLLFFNQEFEN